MGEPAMHEALSAPFPTPPDFYKHFSAGNLARLDALSGQKDAISVLANKPVTLPTEAEELRFLRPPTPPGDGAYRIFNEKRSILDGAPIPEATVHPPLPVHPSSLIIVTRSLLLNFLELLSISALNATPESWGHKMEDLQQLANEAHRSLGQYRSWQARQALIGLMKQMIRDGEAEAQALERAKEDVRGTMKEVTQLMKADEVVGRESGSANDAVAVRELYAEAEEKRLWEVLDQEVEG